MEIDSFLVERLAFHGDKSSEEIKEHAEDGKEHHAFVIDFGGILNSLDGLNDEMDRADHEKTRDDKATNDRVFLAFFVFKEIGDAGGNGVGKTVQRIRGNGSRISKKTADKFDNGKSEIENKSS